MTMFAALQGVGESDLVQFLYDYVCADSVDLITGR